MDTVKTKERDGLCNSRGEMKKEDCLKKKVFLTKMSKKQRNKKRKSGGKRRQSNTPAHWSYGIAHQKT